MKYEVHYSSHFKRDLKRGADISKLNQVVDLLARRKTLPEKYQDHPLRGKYVGYRDCHIEPDWVLI